MQRIDIYGVIVPNDYGPLYEFCGFDCTYPSKVRQVLNDANGQTVDVYINSPGGEISSGSEIYTMLREYGNIHIYITGQACSAASVIAMSGYSEMSPTALMMVHCASTSVDGGNHTEFEHVAEKLSTADRAIASAYATKSSMSINSVLKMMEAETWLTAEKAVALRLIDKVMMSDEPEEDLQMVAAGGFKLPPGDRIKNLKAFLEAPGLKDKLTAKLDLLRLKGE